MLSEPEVVDREAQPYAGVSATMRLREIGEAFPRMMGELASGLSELGITPSSPPFLRYVVIDMEGESLIELGIGVPEPIPGGTALIAGALPAGRYARLIATGPYEELGAANEALQDWAERQGLRFAMSESAAGDRWDARLEIYLTDPMQDPDPSTWRTEIACLLA